MNAPSVLPLGTKHADSKKNGDANVSILVVMDLPAACFSCGLAQVHPQVKQHFNPCCAGFYIYLDCILFKTPSPFETLFPIPT